jgi:hypothetical protein
MTSENTLYNTINNIHSGYFQKKLQEILKLLNLRPAVYMY